MSLSTNIPVICWNYTGMMHSSAGRKNPPVQCEPGDRPYFSLYYKRQWQYPSKSGSAIWSLNSLHMQRFSSVRARRHGQYPPVRFNPSRMASTTCRSSLSRTFMARLLSDLYTHYNMYRPRPQYTNATLCPGLIFMCRNLLHLYETIFVTILAMEWETFPVFRRFRRFQNFRPPYGSVNFSAMFSHQL